MKAYERVAEFNTADNTHRVYDIDRYGREVAPPMSWKVSTTQGNHLEHWEDALLLVANYRADSRTVINGVVQFRRYL